MNEPTFAAIACGLLFFNFLASLTCYSLRNFSWSRLEELCITRKLQPRFGVILRTNEQALLAWEIVWLGCIIALVIDLALWRSADPAVPTWSDWARWIVGLVATVPLLTIIPWSLSHIWGESFLCRCWPVIQLVSTLLSPLLAAAHWLDRMLHRVAGLQEPEESDIVNLNDEIRSVVDEGQREGILESAAQRMIHRVMEMGDEDVAAIMTPRTEMFCLDIDTSLPEARTQLLEAGHTRVPVIGESTDDILGILYAKDMLRYVSPNEGGEPPLREIIREPFYVPETMSLDKLLEEMKRERVHMAIALDEYGGVAGLVTMEDILEEIVGEIVDEYDQAEVEQITRVDADTLDVDARVHIDDLNETFGFDLPEEGDFDTIGGLVFSQLGRVPKPKEMVTWRHLRITVLAADQRKIDKVRIEIDRTVPTSQNETA